MSNCVITSLLAMYVLELATVRWFSLGTLVSSTNKTDCHDITEILLKVALNTLTLVGLNFPPFTFLMDIENFFYN
jgi:hypothetical protein